MRRRMFFVMILFLPFIIEGQEKIHINLSVGESVIYMCKTAKGKTFLNGRRVRLTIVDIDKDSLFGNPEEILIIYDSLSSRHINIGIHECFDMYGVKYVCNEVAENGSLMVLQESPFCIPIATFMDTFPDLHTLRKFKSDYAGWHEEIADSSFKFTYINIVSKNCSPCFSHLSYLPEFKKFNVHPISICVDCSEEDVQRIEKKFNIPCSIYYCDFKEIDKYQLINAFPEYIIVDKNEKIIKMSRADEAIPFSILNNLYLESLNVKMEYNVLFIGNSYLMGKVIDQFYNLCSDNNIQANISKSIYGGYSLSDQLSTINSSTDLSKNFNSIDASLGELLSKNKNWDFVVVVPSGYDDKPFLELRKLVGAHTRILAAKNFSGILWSSELRKKELKANNLALKSITNETNVEWIDMGNIFDMVADNCISACQPFDSTLHLTKCGESILSYLIYQKMFGDLTETKIKKYLSVYDASYTDCLIKILKK